jgi:hypothetical protein
LLRTQRKILKNTLNKVKNNEYRRRKYAENKEQMKQKKRIQKTQKAKNISV